ncbi:4680_t:CDS:2, partial [Scutellospora calospora]
KARERTAEREKTDEYIDIERERYTTFSVSKSDQKDQDGDVDMFIKTQRDNFESKVVTPGQVITADTQYMRGHGTYLNEEESHISSVAGVVERVNKLITVRPLHS